MGAFLLTFAAVLAADPTEKPASPKDALKPLQGLVGSWKGTGKPEGTREEQEKGFWSETVAWAWQFEKGEPSLVATFEKGKHFSRGTLKYDAATGEYRLALVAPDKSERAFVGTLKIGDAKQPILSVERTDPTTKEVQRVVVTQLHANRFLYRYEVQVAVGGSFARVYQVGATKEGEPFASVPRDNECIVTGGKGTGTVTYKGKSYPICCSGCRDAFNEDPEKYIAAAEKAKK